MTPGDAVLRTVGKPFDPRLNVGPLERPLISPELDGARVPA
jgi:hypothetical protein